MTRRVYTYQPGLGWDAYNLIETVGAFLLAAGILVIFANLVWSGFRGAPAGPDPFFGGTLEWTIPSPPPPYNFAVIPAVSSPYPNWDKADRMEDVRRLARGEISLPAGHETPATTVREGRLDEVLEMPAESAFPVLLAVAVTAMFAMLLLSHYAAAAVCGFFALAALVGWHWHEPEEDAA
jgi:cytochrome c oxidase subunit 1/cytochrome c oxidase subunit I+III